MPVNITCRKTEISEGLHDLVVKKARKLKKYFEKVDKIDVVFTAEKHRRKCEITLHAAPFDFNAHAENGDEQAAFEKTLKAISRQIRDNKSKMILRKRKTSLVSALAKDAEAQEDEEEERETA